MKFWRHHVKFLAALQLLPVLESGEETTLVGGQAVMEGVMMRSPHAWGIAIRKPDGTMSVHSEGLEKLSEKHKWMGWPFVRGVATLGQAMMLGFRALQFSANQFLEEEQKDVPKEEQVKISGWVAAGNILLSVGFMIVVYKWLPLFLATKLSHQFGGLTNRFGFHFVDLIDGLLRLAIFLLFIWGMSRMKDISRIFEYHGGEHKTVFAFESGKPVSIEHAQSYPTWHPRCGTSFLMTLMLICIPVYMLFPQMSFAMKLLTRIVMLPVIVGVSYEIIRYAARKQNSLFALMTAPGLWLQRITTQPPSDDQVACAIRALDEAMELEKVRGGELVLA